MTNQQALAIVLALAERALGETACSPAAYARQAEAIDIIREVERAIATARAPEAEDAAIKAAFHKLGFASLYARGDR